MVNFNETVVEGQSTHLNEDSASSENSSSNATVGKTGVEGPKKVDAVKERLWEAGEKLFADKGYEGTSVRDLTNEAQCNIAAVNYYFGGKDNLYEKIVLDKLTYLRNYRLKSIREAIETNGDNMSLENLLRVFANSFLNPLISEEGVRLTNIVVREMLDPHLEPGTIYREVAEPVGSEMMGIMSRMHPDLEREKIFLCLHSLAAQLAYIIRVRRVFKGVNNLKFPDIDTDSFIDHIIQFSTAGVRSYINGET